MRQQRPDQRRRRSAGPVAVVLAGLVAGLGALLGAAPPAVAADATATPSGYDISYPQCGGPFPTAVGHAIVGVNGGIVFSANPCLGTSAGPSELAWAYAADRQPAFYANTGNPGPRLSTHWPSGQRYPRECAVTYPRNDSTGCAYDYGWNAAEDSYADALSAAQEVRGAGAAAPRGDWWLDVETGNTWEATQYPPTPTFEANDVAALQGAVGYLVSVAQVRQVGIYSTPEQWAAITGGAAVVGQRFASRPVWVAGTGSASSAAAHCASSYAFTRGPVVLAQYGAGGYDAHLACG